METYINEILFLYYPYVAISVFLVGSLMRFETSQYTWRSGSSQLLRRKSLIIGSVFFHVGVLAILAGHFVGLLTPHHVYEVVMSAETKQYLAITFGGFFGIVCFIGMTLLLWRRLFDPRIRATSSAMDITILLLLYVQLLLGLGSIPISAGHPDAGTMLALAGWAQHIVTFQTDAPSFVQPVHWVFKTHIVVGLTIFLLFPFSRLVHIWSVPVGYIMRPYQIVRRRH